MTSRERINSISDALRTISISDLPDPQPSHPARLIKTTPIIERLWRIALNNIEANIVETKNGRYFGAGSVYRTLMYTRDISYSGILGVNSLYPDLILNSLMVTRQTRLRLGFRVSRGYSVKAIAAPWEEAPISEQEYVRKYDTNSYTRRTDDVVWLWCIGSLLENYGTFSEWQWLYETGKKFFTVFYDPFFDPEDGLYRGTVFDIHHTDQKTTAYPQNWGIEDCVLVKCTSVNCLYVRAMETMSAVCTRLGLPGEAREWITRGNRLKAAICNGLKCSDGTFTYFKDRHGKLQDRRDALGSALAVLGDVVTGDEAIKALRGYPVSDVGVPLFHPFFPEQNWDQLNNSSWPFVSTFFIQALEKSDGKDRTALNAALLARTCVDDGSFHELLDFRNKEIRGSRCQLWTAAAFINVCQRAKLIEL